MCFECNLQINVVTFSACLTKLHKLYVHVLGLLGPQYNLYLTSTYLVVTCLVYTGKVNFFSLKVLPSGMGSNLKKKEPLDISGTS